MGLCVLESFKDSIWSPNFIQLLGVGYRRKNYVLSLFRGFGEPGTFADHVLL